ncbi:protein of unknown function DUF4217 [Trinorchestia longiramus]|nr:protein of unknown function DUF4217 [Trinorchestia longiramus]
MGKNKQKSKEEKMKKINDCLQLQKRLEEWTDTDPESLKTFSQVPLSTPTFKGLKSQSYHEPTKIQKITLPHTLRGRDVLGEAKTGSGKTLAFVIPIMELLYKEGWTARHGLAALIVTPTRELALQIHDVIVPLARNHKLTSGLVVGGKDLARDWHCISSMNIVVCTPGRLHHLMTKCPNFQAESLKILVLDEADMCLSMGFSEEINAILCYLPRPRQTLLFSATQTSDIKSLARAGIKSDHIVCALHANSTIATPLTLNQCFTTVEAHDKFNFLYSFLTNFKKEKILVFLSTSKQAKFYALAFALLNLPMKILYIHGGMKLERFSHVFDTFKSEKKIVMLATDVVSRGLDFVGVDWVVQLDCPEDVTTYVHRVGRTARYYRDGNALLVLTERESAGMLPQLQNNKVQIEKMDVAPEQIVSQERRLLDIVVKEPTIKEAADRAFKAYIKNIVFMKDSSVFDVTSIDQCKLARSYGLLTSPPVQFVEKDEQSTCKVAAVTSQSEILDDESKSASTMAAQETGARKLLKNPSIKCVKVVDVASHLNVGRWDEFFKETESKVPVPENMKKYLTKRDKVTADNAAKPVFCRPEKKKTYTLKEMCARVHSEYNKSIHREKVKTRKRELLKKRQEKRRSRGQKQDDGVDEKDESDDELDPHTLQIIDELPDPDKIRRRGSDSANNSEDDEQGSSKRMKMNKSVEEDLSEGSDDECSDEENGFQNMALSQQEQFALQLLAGK